jgi:hypothetical protein
MIVHFISKSDQFMVLTGVMLNKTNMWGKFFASGEEAYASLSDDWDGQSVAIYSAEIDEKKICELLSSAINRNHSGVQCLIKSKTIVERKS